MKQVGVVVGVGLIRLYRIVFAWMPRLLRTFSIRQILIASLALACAVLFLVSVPRPSHRGAMSALAGRPGLKA